jgi:chemotaxis protein CheC
MLTHYTEVQLDALREVANVGSGTAATALSSMLGAPVDVNVPAVYALPVADAIEAVGPPEQEATCVVVPVTGELETFVLLLFGARDASRLCTMLGVEVGTEIGESALAEIGNILGASYLGAITAMTGLHLEPAPPQTCVDMLGAMVGTIVAMGAVETDAALLLDSKLVVEGTDANFAFLFLLSPAAGGVGTLLERLGLGA